MTTTSLEIDISDLVADAFADLWTVTIYNDDNITFTHVISALVDVLHISAEAAENHALTAHHEGSAVVAVLPEPDAINAAKSLRERRIPADARGN